MAKNTLYPPSPDNVPEDLTEPTSEYKMQTLLVLFALGLFFMVYFGVMFFCVAYSLWATWFLLFANARVGILRLLPMVFVLPAFLLLIYLLKNLFKFERAQKEFRIEIFPDEHPKLFDFIEKVCEETGATPPKHVFIDYEVNAAAILDTTSFFHLFLPSQRSLLIGLGLLNAINLTEFKALLGHEFGHFSQKGTKIGGYIYTSWRIAYHVIDGEDWFDRFIYGWSQLDPRIAWPAYIVRGVLWVLKKLLELLWYVLVFFNRSCSRQREFNADLFAVSVAGSDAPVHLLHRTYFAGSCFDQAIKDLRTAMSHHLYTSDLFYHQSAAGSVIRRRNKGKDVRLEEPPPLPDDPNETTQVFDEDDDKIAEMWSTHPSNYDREQNAKAQYIRTVFDERSPWLLFDNVEELRERVTYKFYRFYFKIPKDVILADPVEVQGFIDEEHSDRMYDPKYQGLYDYRNLVLKDIGDMAREGHKNQWTITELADSHKNLYTAEVKHRAQLYNKRIEELNMLNAVYNGWHRPKNDELEFRGEIYDMDDAKRLHKKVDKELKNDNTWLAEIDKKVFMTYFQMALHINQEVAEELFRRYDFHLKLQDIWYELQNKNPPIQSAIAFLNSTDSSNLQTHHFKEILNIFRDTHKTLKKMLKTADDMTLPGLKNLPLGNPLRPFLLSKELVDGVSKYEQSISIKWMNKVIAQFGEMKEKVDRIHYKSLAGILTLQEKIGAECVHRWASLPKVQALAH